jgi:starch-binding outer membrane protein, SusD/RagB family
MKAITEKYIKIQAFILFLLIFSGCSEDFLEYDQRGVQTSSSFYKTDAEAYEGLMAVFDNWQQGAGWEYLYLHQSLSDECYAGGGSRGDNSGILEELNEYRFTPSTSQFKDHYSWLYYNINRSNLIVDNVDPDSDNKKTYVAMAKALRAYAYFFLVNLWGDVPLVLHELSADEYNQERTPTADVYTQIETDLTDAIAVLPVRSQLSSDLKNLISKGTAQSILGKVYLFEEKFDEAAAIFQEVIDSNEYGLYPDYSKVLRQDSEYGIESVWEIGFVTTMGYSWPKGESAFGGSSLGWAIMLNPRPEYLGYNADVFAALDLYQYGWGFINPHKDLFDAYTSAGDLVRRNANIISPDSLEKLGHKYETSAGNVPYGSDGYVRLRYLSFLSEGAGETDWAKYCNNGTNCRMIRYADVLLMAAEAYNRKATPDDAKARGFVNLVRTRAELGNINSSGTSLFSDIKLERRLELAFEGQRYLDLQRWGDAYEALKDQGKSIPNGSGGFISPNGAGYDQNKNELLPIPEYEMTVNTKMTQNPGY